MDFLRNIAQGAKAAAITAAKTTASYTVSAGQYIASTSAAKTVVGVAKSATQSVVSSMRRKEVDDALKVIQDYTKTPSQQQQLAIGELERSAIGGVLYVKEEGTDTWTAYFQSITDLEVDHTVTLLQFTARPDDIPVVTNTTQAGFTVLGEIHLAVQEGATTRTRICCVVARAGTLPRGTQARFYAKELQDFVSLQDIFDIIPKNNGLKKSADPTSDERYSWAQFSDEVLSDEDIDTVLITVVEQYNRFFHGDDTVFSLEARNERSAFVVRDACQILWKYIMAQKPPPPAAPASSSSTSTSSSVASPLLPSPAPTNSTLASPLLLTPAPAASSSSSSSTPMSLMTTPAQLTPNSTSLVNDALVTNTPFAPPTPMDDMIDLTPLTTSFSEDQTVYIDLWVYKPDRKLAEYYGKLCPGPNPTPPAVLTVLKNTFAAPASAQLAYYQAYANLDPAIQALAQRPSMDTVPLGDGGIVYLRYDKDVRVESTLPPHVPASAMHRQLRFWLIDNTNQEKQVIYSVASTHPVIGAEQRSESMSVCLDRLRILLPNVPVSEPAKFWQTAVLIPLTGGWLGWTPPPGWFDVRATESAHHFELETPSVYVLMDPFSWDTQELLPLTVPLLA